MCSNCERPSTVWGLDRSGTAVAIEVERLLIRTLAHRPPGMEQEDIDAYVAILPDVPEAIPEPIGIGVAIFVAADPGLLLATSRQVPNRSQRLAVAVFLGPPEDAPVIAGLVLALGTDVGVAASVIAALVESALLGPSGLDWLVWPEGAPEDSVAHVISGVVSQGTVALAFTEGQPTTFGVGRARGSFAARDAALQAITASGSVNAPYGVVVARVGASVSPADLRFAIAACLPQTTEWRVAVFLADGLEHDEVEVVMFSGGKPSVDEAERWPAGADRQPRPEG